jgi:hypothetical protein
MEKSEQHIQNDYRRKWWAGKYGSEVKRENQGDGILLHTCKYIAWRLQDSRHPVLIDGNNVGSYTKNLNVSLFAYVGNRRSLEIHKRECPWVALMSPYNKLPLEDLVQARKRGFDNCATCIGGSLR